MNISNFNKFSDEEKETVFKELSLKYNEENISCFIGYLSTIRKSMEYILDPNFVLEEWNIFQKTFNCFNFEKKESIIKKIIQDVNKVNETFKIFNTDKLCFNVSVGLAGGAIRDLMLMDSPRIKDLDIVVSFRYNEEFLKKNFNFDLKKGEEENEKKFLIEQLKIANKELETLGLLPFNMPGDMNTFGFVDSFISHVSNQILKSNFNIEKQNSVKNDTPLEFVSSNLNSFNEHLKEVIKIKDQTFNYPVDVLITGVSIENYVHVFDFSLCKFYMNCNENLTEKNFIKSIVASKEVWKDLDKKTLTFHADLFDEKGIMRSLNNHYHRIKAKYPEYKLNLISNNIVHSKEFLKMLELNTELPTNKTEQKKFKI